MPIIPAPTTFTHELPHARFYSLATPSRGSRETSVWRARLEPASAAAPHRLTREEIFVVLSGTLRVAFDGQTSEARAGDAIVVPRDTEVTLSCLADAVEVLCCLPVGGQAQIADGPLFTPPWAE